MADYFTNFSLIFELPDQSAQEYALNLAQQATDMRFGEDPPKITADFPASLVDVLELWHFETEAQGSLEQSKYGIWLHSSDGGIDAVCMYIQHLLRKFKLTDVLSFEWSNDCSKPRTDVRRRGRNHHCKENQNHDDRGMAAEADPSSAPGGKPELIQLPTLEDHSTKKGNYHGTITRISAGQAPASQPHPALRSKPR